MPAYSGHLFFRGIFLLNPLFLLFDFSSALLPKNQIAYARQIQNSKS